MTPPADAYTDLFAGLKLFWKHYLRARWLRIYGWAQFHSWGKFHARFTIEAYEHVMKRRSAQQE